MISSRTLARAALGRTALWLIAVLVLAACGRSARAWQDKKEPPLPPEDVTLRTSDGESLAATFYPSRLGKEAVPLVLLHAYKGNRTDFEALALKLQDAGHAVIVPDLRGHGESSGPDDLGLADFANMVRRDLEAVKHFLVEQNNAGELNIERLGIVGIELGATVAINWAVLDWSWPPLATGKQGQDIKALVMISPEWSFRGMRINQAVANPRVRSELSYLIIAGRNNSKLEQAATRLYKALARYHIEPPPEESDEKQTLWLKTPRTSLQGTQLMNERSLGVDEMILAFVQLRLVNPPYTWRVRENPLQ